MKKNKSGSSLIPSRPPDWFALAGIALTIAVHFLITATTNKPNPFFIAGACLFWTIFVIVRTRQNKYALRDWGFRADNLRQAAILPALLLAVIAGVMAGYAYFHCTLRFPLHSWLLFLFYPIWGVIQQFLALAILLTNLERFPFLSRHKFVLVLFNALLFGLIHIYDRPLAAGTFFLELLIIPLYLTHRNLWPLGFLHGWLGGLFYLWVLDQDLWRETFP